NFGLVFPRFEATDLHQQWDKAHAETLQVAATQGLVGLAAYLLLVAAFMRAFWRGRRNVGGFALFAGWLGYTATLPVTLSALAPSQEARRLWPRESVYAVEVGNLAFERQDWALARDAYDDATALGTYNPLVYRNLALADRSLGRVAEGKEAARKAVELNRFDPANQALLAQFEASQP